MKINYTSKLNDLQSKINAEKALQALQQTEAKSCETSVESEEQETPEEAFMTMLMRPQILEKVSEELWAKHSNTDTTEKIKALN